MPSNNSGDAPTPPARPRSARSFASRIESISKSKAPDPKGKGIVLILIGLAVAYALFETFTKGSSASRQVAEGARQNEPKDVPLAPRRTDAPAPTADADLVAPAIQPGLDRGDLPQVVEIILPRLTGVEDLPATLVRDLQLNLSTLATAGFPVESAKEAALRDAGILASLRALPPLVADVPAAVQPTVRSQVLEQFVALLPVKRLRPALFGAAAWLAEDAGEPSEEPLLEFYLQAYQKGLASDPEAPAAILFLEAMPGPLGGPALAGLDQVILDESRPLHVRILAAEARPAEGRSARLDGMAEDPHIAPALRRALGAGRTDK